MSLRISDAASPIQWGAVADVATGAVVGLAKKARAVLKRSQTSVNLTEDRANEADKKLLEVTHRYLGFINRISKGEVPQRDAAVSLLAPDCKKVLNGKVYTKTRDDFISDLLEVNRTQGCWTVKPVDIISSPKNKSVTLRLMIDMEKLGPFTAIVICRFDANNLISEINEVFNKVEDSYHFDKANSRPA